MRPFGLQTRLAIFVVCTLLLFTFSAFTLPQLSSISHSKAPTCNVSESVSPSYIGTTSGTNLRFVAAWSCSNSGKNLVKVYWGDGGSNIGVPGGISGSDTFYHTYYTCTNCTVTFYPEFQLYGFYYSGSRVIDVVYATVVVSDPCCKLNRN
jgi:hypothetical protein